MKKEYYLINVIGKDGYSFVVYGCFKDDEDAIEQAQKRSLFQDEEDANRACAEIASYEDVKHFRECECLFDLTSGSKTVSVEFYFENGQYGIYAAGSSDSGITVNGNTPEECAKNFYPYLKDYLTNLCRI